MKENNNDSRSITEAFLQVEQKLKRYLMRFLMHRQDVEDIVQETILKAYEAEKNTEVRSPKPFLFKIAHNLAITEIVRKRKKLMVTLGALEESEALDDGRTPEAEAEMDALLQEMGAALRDLSPRCRSVLIMRKVYGFSHKEIGQRMGISVKTVENHLTRALRHCQVAMSVKDDEAGRRHRKGT
ncbi:MAG: RNA polymerase sigma factor [Azoarcus sp.]|jgi:RNA polymerase sigma-70 factor (ECF subfamily)|nr:RNA polymerase sigma factor [Azoarcus sp.]